MVRALINSLVTFCPDFPSFPAPFSTLSADRLWLLSGTPPIYDFTAIKTTAAHLYLHLAIDDDNECKSVEVEKRPQE